jgi:hypothetical protein
VYVLRNLCNFFVSGLFSECKANDGYAFTKISHLVKFLMDIIGHSLCDHSFCNADLSCPRRSYFGSISYHAIYVVVCIFSFYEL